MAKILIIDDDQLNSALLFEIINSMGHDVECAFTAEEGLRKALSHNFDVVFLDIHLPDGNGLMLLPRIQGAPSSPEVIIITGYGSPEGAELAIKNGAWDFIEKPLVRNQIELPLVRALQYREAKRINKEPLLLRREGIIGSSQEMSACIRLVAQAAASNTPVLITGETGTGKELFARAIHNNSTISKGPFVTVDCASLPPTIIESVLFGHEKGSFTGADKSREGLVKQADGGTLFLDEVGELTLEAQKAFLRVLQERTFRPVGGNREVKSNFRLIAATNRNIDEMVHNGRFREDLLFRLRAFTLELPPLKKRSGDVRELCFHYVNRLCDRDNKEIKGFSPEFMDLLCLYEWPGNVRELVQALESAITAANDDPILFPKHLPMHIRVSLIRDAAQKKDEFSSPDIEIGTLKEYRNAVIAREEANYLRKLFSSTDGNIQKASEISGLSRVRLYVLLNKYNIRRNSPASVS
ncbi:MAG: Transcriptional regulatory protein ZraR [Syntrophus sp. PtaB.Bin001]|nr:MAG: Transcriptional regulatory protein ZraR [Syntrophus sp. PtaB.Bin001]